ncbi:3862_t:CDS:2, partial [Funneliformis caledonium]
MIKSSTFSGIVRVDAKATRHSDGLDVWHMEVSGPSDNASDKLYALNMLPDGRFLATELASVVIPFSFNGRSQYISILRMMTIFHEEIEKQETLMEEINSCVLRSKGTTVRQ